MPCWYSLGRICFLRGRIKRPGHALRSRGHVSNSQRLWRRSRVPASVAASEGQSRVPLNLTAGRRRLRDRAKLRRVDEAVRCAEVHVVEGVEEFDAELESHTLS